MDFVIETLAEAAKESPKKPVIIIEDIHSLKGMQTKTGEWIATTLPDNASILAGQLVNLYNKGIIHVVYTLSDYSGVTLLQGGSFLGWSTSTWGYKLSKGGVFIYDGDFD